MAIYTRWGNEVEIVRSEVFSFQAVNSDEIAEDDFVTVMCEDGNERSYWRSELRADGGLDEIDAAISAIKAVS
jgi:hypothetical protein